MPISKRKQQLSTPSKSLSVYAEPEKDLPPTRSTKGDGSEGPPGFPPLFPELSEEEQRMEVQYVSHADETEKNARISHVRQSIIESPKVQDVMLRISHDLNKDKRHVLDCNPQVTGTSVHLRLGKHLSKSLPDPRTFDGYESENSVAQNVSSNFKIQGATVFSSWKSCPSVNTVILGTKKRNKNRPTAW